MSRGLVVLFVLIFSALADHVVSLNGVVTVADPIFTVFTHNFQSDATITVDHTAPVRVCLRQAWDDSNFKFQNNSAYWNITCDLFWDLQPTPPSPTPTPTPAPSETPTPTPAPSDTPTPTPSPSETPTPTPTPAPSETPTPTPTPTPAPSETPTPTPTPTPAPSETPTPTPTPAPSETPTPTPAPTPSPAKRSILNLADALSWKTARGVKYSLAVALLSPTDPAKDKAVVNVTIDGVVCDDPTKPILDQAKGECFQPPQFTGFAEDVELKANEVKYFSFNVPRLTGSFQLRSTDASVGFAVRYNANPQTSPDATGASIDVSNPRPGVWYLAVTSPKEVDFNITSNFEDCSKANNTAGPGCKTGYILINEDKQYQMGINSVKGGVWTYFKVEANDTTPLWVSVRTDSGEDFPVMYALRDNLPTADSYDVKNCNFDYCDGAFIIRLNFTQNETQTWFIGTYTEKANNSYGVWFNSPCAQECTDQNTGACTTTDPGYGICVCATSSLTGVDCTIRNGLPPEYIVLIIIAALVVASAIIGFVAWAYMRRKRVQYEQVTG